VKWLSDTRKCRPSWKGEDCSETDEREESKMLGHNWQTLLLSFSRKYTNESCLSSPCLECESLLHQA
jgi:hypothetical protein